ncbi:MAG TPA: glycosyltransferase family A protein, partial [Pyrinomonadaceae bacterium]|nr:glycosyltransferase family A protein [Pyrinomonadaceae bacterium]
ETEGAQTRSSPSVSVVIPTYNVAPFIAETLNSVFAQTFTDFEVIVVDDGSDDAEELERALEPYLERVRYVRQENLGAGAARNRGVQEARGEFIAFLDSDDLWMPEYLEEQVRFLRADGYDLAYADALLFGDSPIAGKTYMQTAPSVGPVTFLSLVRNECNIITSGVVARRCVLVKVGLFNESLRNGQDFELWARLARSGAHLGYQRKVLLRYRCREGSLSGDVMNRLTRETRVYQHIADNYDLTAEERAEVSRTMELQRGAFELATAKLNLLDGQFEEARSSFERAHGVLGGWKLRAVVLMLRVAPRLLRRLALSRLRTAS